MTVHPRAAATELPAADPDPELPSFLIAGFEGADHRNSSGRPVAMLDATLHSANVARDYARLRTLGIRTVRESVGWRSCERDGRFDFSSALHRADLARRHGLTIMWTYWHYGWPDDLALDDPSVARRFAAFAHAAATALHDRSEPQPIVSAVNEISFLAWATTASALIFPYRGGNDETWRANGYTLKRQLVRATLAGCDAIRDAVPAARLLHIDPLVHIVAPRESPSLAEEAARVRAFQFQAWDMLAGRTEPQLGGAPHYLDLLGVNYYHANQFELDTERRLHWHLRDARRIPFRALLQEAFERYGRTLLVAETSHFGVGRDRWLCEIATEVRCAMKRGVRIAGLCLYPITDRPDWERAQQWHRSGLWDRELDAQARRSIA